MHPLLADTRGEVPLAEAYTACARLARHTARNFYYSFLPLRRAKRLVLYAVYSFARVADDLADAEGFSESERLSGLDRLEARLDEIERGQPRGALFIALADAVANHAVPIGALRDLLQGMRQDLTVNRYVTWAELEQYCYYAAGTIGLVCAATFGGGSETARRHALAQGLGMQYVNIIRDVGADAALGRIYLPADLLNEYAVREEDILAGHRPAGWIPLMSEVARRARSALEEGAGLLPLIDRDARVCPALLRDLYEGVLDRIEASGFDVLEHRHGLNTLTKLRLMVRAFIRWRLRGGA